MTTRAFARRGKVSEAERLYIEARYYSTVQPDVRKATETYRLILATYPDDYTALANSSLLLKQQGQLDEALVNLEHAVRVAPDQPIGWGNLGETYMQLGRFSDARRAYESALKLQESAGFRSGLFIIGVVTDDAALADAQVNAMRGKRDEVDFLLSRVQALAYRGRLKDASALVTEWQARMEQASRGGRTGGGQMDQAINEALSGLADEARDRVESARADDLLTPDTIAEQLVLAAVLRDGRQTRTLLPAALAELKKASGDNPQAERGFRALAALAESRPADAATLLDPPTFDLPHSDEVTMWSIAQMQGQHWAEAAKGFGWLDQTRGRTSLSTFQGFTLVSLARAQAALGQAGEARKTYERFFALWSDADADLPLLQQAKAEFAKLSGSS
jgi:tetratricopeptide (TPR) repeat protein